MDKKILSLVVYRLVCNVVTSIITQRKILQNFEVFTLKI